MALIRDALNSEAYDREYSNRVLVHRIAGYFGAHRRELVMVIVTVSLLSFLGVLGPLLVAWGVGFIESNRPTATSSGVLTSPTALLLVSSILVLGIVTWMVNYVRRLRTAELMGSVIMDMRTDAFRAVVNHDLSFFDSLQSGRIVSRITSDTDEFGRVSVVVTEVVSQLIVVLILVVYLLSVNWQLTVLLVLLSMTGVVVASRFQQVARRISRQSQRAIAEVNVAIQEAVTGIRVAKNFRSEQRIYDEFAAVNAQSYAIQVKRGLVLSSVFPTLQFFVGTGTAVLLYLGGYYTAASVISAGSWFLFMNSVMEFWFPMTNLSAFWSQFQSALSATERIFALMDARPVIVQSASEAVTRLRGAIDFDQVDFRYSDKEQVLSAFTLHVRPGESVALVGHTGAGKSSAAAGPTASPPTVWRNRRGHARR